MLRKPERAKLNDNWMVSFGSMMTILFAFFVVLSSLAKDQTGFTLAQGVGSFKESLRTFGLAGLFPRSRHDVLGDGINPRYAMPDDDPSREPQTSREAPESNRRMIDLESEQFDQFMSELRQQYPVETQQKASGSSTFDLYAAMNPSAPYLAQKHRELLLQVSAVLPQGPYRVFVVVWATLPTAEGWLRATREAQQAVQEIANLARLDGRTKSRLIPQGRLWPYADLQRPVMSVIVTKLEE